MRAKQTTILIILLTMIGCSDDEHAFKPHDIAGYWVMTSVDHDGEIMSEWKGVHLTFEQTTGSSGHYSTADTKYDSIWSQSGPWRITERPGELILDDTLSATFHADREILIVQKLLPWTGRPACVDGICTPIIRGNWHFEFKRNK